MIKLAIVGSRDFTDYETFQQALAEFISEYGMPTSIISGGARGADSMAEKWSLEEDIPIVIYYPDWNTYGRAAGPIRNSQIVNDATHMIAFPVGESRGTQDSIRKARAKRIPLKVIS